MDLVEILREYCNSNDIEFSYGSQSVQNLLQANDSVEDTVYLLCDLVKEDDIVNTHNTGFVGTEYKGLLMLGVKGDYTEHIYNENNSDYTESKYTKNVKPMKELKRKIAKDLMCGGYDVKFTNSIDIYNYKDINLDGIIFSYNIKQYD